MSDGITCIDELYVGTNIQFCILVPKNVINFIDNVKVFFIDETFKAMLPFL